jgi:hypothetical protein
MACSSLVFACGSSGRDADVPAAMAAESQAAERAFHRVHTKWWSTPPPRRVALASDIEAFLARFRSDPTARRVELYLAWVRVENGELDRARALLDQRRVGRQGALADFAAIVDGAILSRRGRPKAALSRLEPLRGKIIDSDDRALYAGELVRAALGAKLYRRAVDYMVDWAEQTSEGHSESVKASISDQIRTIPSSALEQALPALMFGRAEEAGSARAAARQWLAKNVRDQLIRWALTRQDVQLARRLLDVLPSSLRLDEAREALRQLAARGISAPRIAGRAIGMVLEVSSERARRRSAEVAFGISAALSLTRRNDSGVEAVRLLSRDAEEQAIHGALSALAGEGAAILVVGVTEESADSAAEFAEAKRIPVALVTPPSRPVSDRGFAFVLGESEGAERAALSNAMRDRGHRQEIVVGFGGVSCDAPSQGAGRARFPVREWRKEGVDALLLLGDPACSTDVMAEIRGAGLAPLVALGLESAPLVNVAGPGTVFVAGAGRFAPVPMDSIAEVDSSRRDSVATWFGTLGADAARLGAATLADFPMEQVKDDVAVGELHRRARDRLASVEVSLDSTELTGFAGHRRLARTLRAIERRGSAR